MTLEACGRYCGAAQLQTYSFVFLTQFKGGKRPFLMRSIGPELHMHAGATNPTCAGYLLKWDKHMTRTINQKCEWAKITRQSGNADNNPIVTTSPVGNNWHKESSFMCRADVLCYCKLLAQKKMGFISTLKKHLWLLRRQTEVEHPTRKDSNGQTSGGRARRLKAVHTWFCFNKELLKGTRKYLHHALFLNQKHLWGFIAARYRCMKWHSKQWQVEKLRVHLRFVCKATETDLGGYMGHWRLQLYGFNTACKYVELNS